VRFASVAVALAACGTSVPTLPVNPGGGGGGGGGGHLDAAIDSSDGGGGDAGMLAGRVCLAVDPRQLTQCATTGASGFTVRLGTQSATTGDDGSFTMPTPQGSALVWHVSGATIVPSVMPAGVIPEIPALSDVTYSELTNSNGVVLAVDQGSMFARIVHAGTPLVGATALASPAAQFDTLYDSTSATAWTPSATGAHGVAWLPGLAAGTAALSVTPSGANAVAVATLPVEAGSITFVVADIP
jgi:hypothetical protein